MLLTSIDPFVQEFERQFDRLARQASGRGAEGAPMPMDGIRRADDVVLRFDLPGIDPGSVEVTVDRGVLTVSARREEELGEDERPFVRERTMGVFTRRVYLSEHLDAEAVEAAYDNGVLAVRIPVLERAKPRKIEIRTGEGGQRALSR
ncbi:Hsp20/alpha crystallin family protein [Actinomadura parmotrematis]|uniref:Hsp20/alpha crystallin family protein n=1 Tax=Actinomadura parmotrematis TaxID=2864039 RepID=A0ABS7G5M1_9ACTN|nr:Hsp20/alpha crystallin family protein [Actinomadura parmotrematis]MBW8486938.1 Hsp20/alpha crystallin family protein [Actinomadura parmotrematis]